MVTLPLLVALLAAGATAPPVWPVPPPVSRDLALPAVPWAAGHRGLDLPAAEGTPVRAPRAGRVLWTGLVAGKPVVVLGHGPWRSTYEPVAAVLPPGATVSAGQVIGVTAAGASHCAGACLHWGLRDGSGYADPRLLLATRARLLPLTGRRPPPVAPATG